MYRKILIISIFVLAILLAACTSTAEPAPTATLPEIPTEHSQPPATAATTPDVATPTVSPTATSPQELPASPGIPLAEPGPYYVGTTEMKLVDESRGGRKITVSLYYPALKTQDADGRVIKRNAPPDMSGVPYPVILTASNSGDFLFQFHLASHGFVMAVVRFPDLDYGSNWGFGVIDHPQDMVFALEQLASNPPEGLAGVIDSEHAGATGYSWDGFFSLVLGGARIDPAYYLAHCQDPPSIETGLGAEAYLAMTCSLAQQWDEFTAHVGEEITAGEDGLWQPVTDRRISAVLPMAADGAWLYGERGLAAVDRPTLLIAPTKDEGIPYLVETQFIFKYLGDPEKALISFIDKTHMMVGDAEQADQMKHFATAYFGYHLQGKEEYRQYFSEDFVAQFPDLAWGIYTGQ